MRGDKLETSCKPPSHLTKDLASDYFIIVHQKQNDRKLKLQPGKSHWGGRLSTVDLLVLTILDQLIFKLKVFFSFLTKQATLRRRSTVLSLPPQLVFLAATDEVCGVNGGLKWRNNTQHNDTQDNDTQHNDTQHNRK